MKKTAGQLAFALVLVWLVSAAAALLAGGEKGVEEVPETELTQPWEVHTVNVQVEGQEVCMELEDYLTGVLISEVPESFHLEAKKAQAVAARTFTLRMEENPYRHGTCAVCDDPGCCQGYLTEEAYFGYGGTETGLALARQAVEETADMVLTYGGALIEATYFSCSGGRTEDAVAVWGTEVPYLQAVDSPGEEAAAFYTDSVRFSAQELQSKLGVTLKGAPNEWFGAVEYTGGEGVASMVVGGKTFTGNELRSLLQLRSTRFEVTALSDSVIITTRGFGHRVGLSQYGADAMARAGSSWREILSHYYQGVQIEKDGP